MCLGVFALASAVLAQDPPPAPSGGGDYRGVDDFFMVREANANVDEGQWEFEIGAAWGTHKSSSGRDDLFTLTPSLKYAFSDTFNIELGFLPLNIGDGRGFGTSDPGYSGNGGARDWTDYGQDRRFNRRGNWWGGGDNEISNGNGDVNFKTYCEFLSEAEAWLAAAFWTDLRIPTGNGSEKVDANFTLNLTKTIVEGVRAHIQGSLMTANGSRGDADIFGDRRDFQYGIGVGFDFAIDDSNTVLVSYMNRASEYEGNASTNGYEIGWVTALADNQHLQLGVNYADVRGETEGPRWTGKVQYAFSW